MTKEITQIGAVGSPSTNLEITVDVLDQASSKGLVGSLLYIDAVQDDRPMRITGQVTGISMSNKWHQNDTMRAIIKTDGSLPWLSGHQDIRVADFLQAVLVKMLRNWEAETLSNVPYSGTAVNKLEQHIVDDLVEQYSDDVVQLGFALGDSSVRIPMFLKHFGSRETGGLSESIHQSIIGRTGSGKSTQAKSIISLYARHPEMAILILDPKGEFADEIAGYQVGESGLPFKEILQSYGRELKRYGITQIQLQTWDLFRDILESTEFHRDCGVSAGENAIELGEAIEEILRKSNFRLDNLDENALQFILEELLYEESVYPSRIYKTEEPRNRFLRVLEQIKDNRGEHRAWKTWGFISFLFSRGTNDQKRRSISSIVRELIKSETGNRPLVALDLGVAGNKRDLNEILSDESMNLSFDTEKDLFTASLQSKILYRILSELRRG